VISQVPAAIQYFRNRVASEVNAKLNEFNDQLSDIQNAIQTSKIKSRAANKIDEFKFVGILEEKLAEIQASVESTTLDRVTQLSQHSSPINFLTVHDNGADIVKEKQKELKLIIDKTTKDIGDALNKVGDGSNSRVSIALNIFDTHLTHVDLRNMLEETANKIVSVDTKIEETECQLEAIEKHKYNIYNTLMPFLSKFELVMKNFQYALDGKSGADRDTAQWGVSVILKNVRKAISKQFTQGFEMDEDLTSCFELLEEGMATVIRVFDQINSYPRSSNV
jgi:hypothetical protein